MAYHKPGEYLTIAYVDFNNGEDGKDYAWAELYPDECNFCHQYRPIINIDSSNGEYAPRYICEECMTRAFRLFDAEYIPPGAP